MKLLLTADTIRKYTESGTELDTYKRRTQTQKVRKPKVNYEIHLPKATKARKKSF